MAVPDGERLEDHRAAVEAALARVAEVDRVVDVVGPFTAGTVSADGRIAGCYVHGLFGAATILFGLSRPVQICRLGDSVSNIITLATLAAFQVRRETEG